jgi:hypothetical protein
VTEGIKEKAVGIGGITARAASRLAWLLWALSVALTTLSLVLLVLIRSHPGTHVFDWWLGNATIVIDVTVGAIVASRRPENPVGWLLCLSGIAVSTSSFTSEYAIYALLAEPNSLPAGEAMAWIAAWMLPIMSGLQVAYLMLFPTGRLPSRRWRWLAWLTVAYILVGVITAAFSPGAYQGSLGPIRNPLGIEGFTQFYKAVVYIMAPTLYIAAAISLFIRLRRAVGVERQQLKWLAYAAGGFAVGIVLISISIAIDTPRWYEWVASAIFTAVSPGVPISIGIAILRYRLYDIDIIINRTLVYGSLTVLLAGIYEVSIVLLQEAFRALTGQHSGLAIVASTLLIAALFTPFRRRIQSFIDRLFYRNKYDAAKTMETFSAKLRDETDLQALSNQVVEVVRRTMQPAHVSLWLRPDPEPKSRSAALRQFGHKE